MLAAIESGSAGHPLSSEVWQRLCAMVDSGAALLDERMRPPRQGDGDEGRALLLDAPGARTGGQPCSRSPPRSSAASTGGRPSQPTRSARSSAPCQRQRGSSLAGPESGPGTSAMRGRRCCVRPADTIRRSGAVATAVAHGFLSIAAHAHADALSVELRYGGVDIFADPGTYCYHGEPEWRSYFRSTIAHNTVEVDGQNQSADGGAFLWLQARERDGDRRSGRR